MTQEDIDRAAAAGSVAVGSKAKALPATPDDYQDRLLKYVPTEVIGVFIALDALLKSAGGNVHKDVLSWIAFVVLLVLTPIYVFRLQDVRKFLQLGIAAVSFFVWVFTLGGPFTQFSWYSTFYGGFVLPLYTFIVPIVEAKRCEIVSDDHAIGDHVRILPTPGHTPGHSAFKLGRGKDDAVFSGDLMHSPIQTRYPEMSVKFDVDQAAAGKTRRSFLERYCDTDTLCCTAHFPSPSVGRIRRKGNGFSCETV